MKNNQGGLVSLGYRTTISTFNDGKFTNAGIGVGGQFRIQFADIVNTDWYADYIVSDIGDFATRTDYHIGWSVLCYFTKKQNPLIKPYILAGHCFDWTKVVSKTSPFSSMKRMSSAIQAGAGFHLNLSPRLDLSFVSQYMIHLGGDVHAHRHSDGTVGFEKENGAGLEGHLLFHIGINYKIFDLW